jgi:hypothetical protein
MGYGPEERERYQRYLNSREWGVKKEAVRRRAGGVCERCKLNPVDLVHHLTYIRKYDERLEDLQAICQGCHDFIHGRSDHDPRASRPVIFAGKTITSVYLAGKVGGSDWRSKVLADPAVFGDVHANVPLVTREGWPRVEAAIRLSDGRALAYTGPYRSFLGEHGASDAAGHCFNFNENDSPTVDDLPALCAFAIRHSDLVFGWIDRTDCYGTLVEVGLARADGIPIFISGPRLFPDLWFAYALADRVFFDVPNNPLFSLESMLAGYGDALPAYREACRTNSHFDPIGEESRFRQDGVA